MQGLPDRLGDWALSIIERLVPSAVGFEDYSSLIGYLVILGLALIVVWLSTIYVLGKEHRRRSAEAEPRLQAEPLPA